MGGMSLLNRMIFPIAPKLAIERERWRQAGLTYLRGFYTAADQSARSSGWTTVNASGEQVNQGERDIVRARSRDLERNSDLMSSQLLALERNVIGTGIVLQSKILDADGREDDALNEKIEALWGKWCLPENCEITERWSLSELQALAVRRRFVDGGALILMVYVEGRFCLQLLEVDDLDSSVQTSGNHRVVGGIELDEYRRAIAYHIKIYDAWGYQTKAQRVPKEQVIYMPYLSRPSQVREFSPTAASIARIDDTNELIDAAIEKERVLAHLSLVVESDTNASIGSLYDLGRGFGGSHAAAKEDDPPVEILDQGTITRLKAGEKISAISPAGTSAIVDPMVKTTQRLSGAGLGLSYEVVSRDMSQTNYSSARQGLLEDQKTYRGLQKYLIEHFCNRVYKEWFDWMVLSGQLELPSYFREPEKYTRHQWITSGWDWIDPVKEVVANAKALESHQTTLQEICASKGRDYRDVVRQRQIECELIEELMKGVDPDGPEA